MAQQELATKAATAAAAVGQHIPQPYRVALAGRAAKAAAGVGAVDVVAQRRPSAVLAASGALATLW